MTCTGESPREASVPTLLTTRIKTRIGTWNVRTLYETGKSAQVRQEMHRYNLKLLGLCETRWTGTGRTRLASGDTIIYSGQEGQPLTHMESRCWWHPRQSEQITTSSRGCHKRSRVLPQCKCQSTRENWAESDSKYILFTHTCIVILHLNNTKSRLPPPWEDIKGSASNMAHRSVFHCVVGVVVSGTGLQELKDVQGIFLPIFLIFFFF